MNDLRRWHRNARRGVLACLRDGARPAVFPWAALAVRDEPLDDFADRHDPRALPPALPPVLPFVVRQSGWWVLAAVRRELAARGLSEPDMDARDYDPFEHLMRVQEGRS